MQVIFPDPFETLFSLQQALDDFRDSGWLQGGPSSTGQFPPLNVFRKGEDFVVLAELPGMRKSELEIQVKENTLRIAGTKSVESPEKSSAHRRERMSGRFDRAISIPVQIDADRVKAEYRDGILALYLPRAARDKPKTVKVN